MILIGNKVFAIEPGDSKIMQFMRELDPEHVEVYTRDVCKEVHQERIEVFGFNLETAEWMYGGKEG